MSRREFSKSCATLSTAILVELKLIAPESLDVEPSVEHHTGETDPSGTDDATGLDSVVLIDDERRQRTLEKTAEWFAILRAQERSLAELALEICNRFESDRQTSIEERCGICRAEFAEGLEWSLVAVTNWATKKLHRARRRDPASLLMIDWSNAGGRVSWSEDPAWEETFLEVVESTLEVEGKAPHELAKDLAGWVCDAVRHGEIWLPNLARVGDSNPLRTVFRLLPCDDREVRRIDAAASPRPHEISEDRGTVQHRDSEVTLLDAGKSPVLGAHADFGCASTSKSGDVSDLSTHSKAETVRTRPDDARAPIAFAHGESRHGTTASESGPRSSDDARNLDDLTPDEGVLVWSPEDIDPPLVRALVESLAEQTRTSRRDACRAILDAAKEQIIARAHRDDMEGVQRLASLSRCVADAARLFDWDDPDGA
jgi:hypothetical protein